MKDPQGPICRTVNKIYFSGETLHAAKMSADLLALQGVASVLDYAVEGEDEESTFDKALENTLRLIELSSQSDNLPFIVIKPSALGASHIYKLRADTAQEGWCGIEWQRIKDRYKRIFDTARQFNVKIMVDAEHVLIQNSVNDLIIDFMGTYNTESPLISLTLQFYLKDQMARLKGYYHLACSRKFWLGVKVVRGAYLETEYALNHGEVCFATKEETDNSYNQAISYIAQRMDVIYPMFATHNEVSLKLIMQNDLLSEARVWTGQLYGIADHVTASLRSKNCPVCKYLPFGPASKSLPYLLRRIEENAVSYETFKNENPILRHEIWCRLTGRRTCE